LQTAKIKTDTLAMPIHVNDKALEDIVSWYKRWWRVYEEGLVSGKWDMELSACTPYSQYGTQGFVCEYQQLCMTDYPEELVGMFSVRDPHHLAGEESEG